MTMHMPYLIQTVCDGCVQCVYLEHSPICHSLSLLSLWPAPGSGWRGWWPSQSPQTPVSQPPGPVIPSSAPVTSIPPARAFYIYTGTFKQVVFKYSDTMILLFVQCENVPTCVDCMYVYQHCTYYLLSTMFKIKYDKNDDDICSKILLRPVTLCCNCAAQAQI